MDNQSLNQQGLGTAVAEHVQDCRPAPKWAALVNDRLFPMPRRKRTARDILDQAGFGQDVVLVRDHESRNDVSFADDAEVDLADGNVFRAVQRCQAGPGGGPCRGAAKLAFVCDDEWEVTLVGAQTGRSLKRLLGLPEEAEILRDRESPNDDLVRDEDDLGFRDGPVFTCRNRPPARQTTIYVNGREKVVAGKTISYADLVVLAFGAIDPNTIYTVTYKHGPPSKPEGIMAPGDVVKLNCGMHFNVTPTCKS